MGIELTALHWIYLLFIILIIGFMVKRRDTTLICIVGIFLLAIFATGNIASSISGIFNSFIFAITELLSTILIISIIVAMSPVLTKTGINDVMISPFTKFIKTPTLAFWIIGIVMMGDFLVFLAITSCSALRGCVVTGRHPGWFASTWCRHGDEPIRSRHCIIRGFHYSSCT